MGFLTDTALGQLQETYRRMAEDARYRPAAPSDGLGNITMPVQELDLDAEAVTYAAEWEAEEDDQSFVIGCCDWSTRPATVFAIEAARLMCSGAGGREPALRLLKMAVEDLEDSHQAYG